MSFNKKKLKVFSLAHSVLVGAGSILGLAGGVTPFSHSPMARQDRDVRFINSDWRRVGGDIRSAMDKSDRYAKRK